MKRNILKAVVSCTMALSLLLVGYVSFHTAPGFTVFHDGPIHGGVIY